MLMWPIIKAAMTEIHILNLGAGVQSTDLYLRAAHGELPPYDYAICSDTQDEFGAEHRRRGEPDPEGSFYSHLEWLGSQALFLDSQSPLVSGSNAAGKGCPILVRTRGWISADLSRGENSTGQRFASIPAFVSNKEGGDEGMVRRQCTKEYKVEVIDRTIRYEILGLQPGDRLPKDVVVHQHIGISWDERTRAFDIARRFRVDETERVEQSQLFEDEPTVIHVVTGHRQKANWRCHFDLIEDGRQITREQSSENLRRWVPYEVNGSSCIMCPFKDDPTWQKHMEPGITRDALIQIDHNLRSPGAIVNRNLEQSLYLHRACRPIEQIDFTRGRQLLDGGLSQECEGGCGL